MKNSDEMMDRYEKANTTIGTRENAETLTRGRHPGTQSALQWLAFSHLPPALQLFAEPFYIAAASLIAAVREDSPELTTSLNGLIAAKDSAVRAGIRFQQGYPGPMARPQEVVNPPLFGSAQVPARPDQRIPGL